MCISPLKGIVYGVNPSNGKKLLKVVGQEFVPSDNDNIIPIPCGKCIECRLNKSRVWADRMMAEAAYHKDNVFLTLTYDNDHLPVPLTRFTESGDLEVSPVHPLVKSDLQKFMKRLRKKFSDQKIRYYACGEYGDKSMRPHYHLILFGLALDDAKLLYKTDDGISYYTSQSISDVWSFGMHVASAVTWNSCAYVSRYVMKKLVHGYDDLPEKLNYPKEFSVMSRKPGIGRQFYDDHYVEISLFNGAYLPTDEGSRLIRSNKYYDSVFELIDEDLFSLLKEERKVKSTLREDLMNELTDKNYNARLLDRKLYLESRTKNFDRKEI